MVLPVNIHRSGHDICQSMTATSPRFCCLDICQNELWLLEPSETTHTCLGLNLGSSNNLLPDAIALCNAPRSSRTFFLAESKDGLPSSMRSVTATRRFLMSFHRCVYSNVQQISEFFPVSSGYLYSYVMYSSILVR